MYISKLELKGFKSFANKTTIQLSSGITGVVGPNGCGKSNIVDALRWVLGEQRASQLRSTAMASVIFNGTKDRKKAGFSEVALTINNNKGLLPSEFEELTITRRLFRTGQSEYLLNGTSCRLKDIQALFVDTGLSTNAYSVIELKAVEGIVDDKNNERRKLFEEAAGVTKFKEQRRDTHKKLKETREDLQRLSDILLIMEKKVKSLETQSRKARQLKELQVELLDLDQVSAAFEFQKITAELLPLQNQLKQAEADKIAGQTALEQAEKHLNATRESSSASLEREEVHNQNYIRYQEQYSQLQTQLKLDIQQATLLEDQTQNTSIEIEESEARLEELVDLLKHTKQKYEMVNTSYIQSEQLLNEAKQQFDELLEAFNDERRKAELKDKEYASIRNELSSSNETVVRAQASMEFKQNRLQELQTEAIKLQERLLILNEDVSQANNILESASKDFTQEEEQLRVYLNNLDLLDEELDLSKPILSEHKAQLKALEAEFAMLKHLDETDAYSAESVRQLIKAKSSIGLENLCTFASVIQTSQKEAAATELVLGQYADALIVENTDQKTSLIAYAEKQKLGRLPVVVLEQLPTSNNTALEGSLANAITTNAAYKNLVNLFFGKVFIELATNEERLKSIQQHFANGAQVVVDSEHNIWFNNGLQYVGKTSEQIGQRLALKKRLEEAESAKGKLQIRIDELDQQQSFKLEERLALKAQIQLLKEEVQQKQKMLSTAIQQQKSLILALDAIDERIEKNELDQEAQSTQLKVVQETYKTAKEALEIAAKALSNFEQQMGDNQQELRQLEEQKNLAQRLFHENKLKSQDLGNQRLNLDKDIERNSQTIKRLEQTIGEKKTKILQAHEQVLTLNNKITEDQLALEISRVEVNEALDIVREIKQENASLRGAIKQLEDDVRDQMRKKELNVDLSHHLSMALQNLSQQLKQISERVWEDYNKLVKQLEVVLPEEFDLEGAKTRLKAIRHRIQAIGQVNELAIDEYEAEKENLDFYLKQVADLEKAERQLLQSLEEINKTAVERFNNTFSQIRDNFITVFKTLFDDDDECDLLIDEEAEDVLEAQIKIMARPKGKRPSSISQLSGGEKTLTATALLFAIYLVKPSPFCVLDEVDAPLDDANIERFANMVKEFSKETQFIIVTHNKNTMANAGRLYGVTMIESGVSQLVAVDISGLDVEN